MSSTPSARPVDASAYTERSPASQRSWWARFLPPIVGAISGMTAAALFPRYVWWMASALITVGIPGTWWLARRRRRRTART
ncbi:MAG: hypothetical protein ACOH17_13085 [Cellulomonas sp.]